MLTGGQQRPGYSSRFWEPTASDSEEDTAVDVIGEEQITVEVASSEEEPAEVESVPLIQPVQLGWLGPKGIPKARGWRPEFERRVVASEYLHLHHLGAYQFPTVQHQLNLSSSSQV